jgi:hypothetical protein
MMMVMMMMMMMMDDDDDDDDDGGDRSKRENWRVEISMHAGLHVWRVKVLTACCPPRSQGLVSLPLLILWQAQTAPQHDGPARSPMGPANRDPATIILFKSMSSHSMV